MDDIIGQFLGTSISTNNPIKDDRIHGKGYATLLTNNNFYPGVEALCKSLKATSTGTQYIAIMMYTSMRLCSFNKKTNLYCSVIIYGRSI
jgi:hypothetical protein